MHEIDLTDLDKRGIRNVLKIQIARLGFSSGKVHTWVWIFLLFFAVPIQANTLCDLLLKTDENQVDNQVNDVRNSTQSVVIRDDMKLLVKTMLEGRPNTWHLTGFQKTYSTNSRFYQRGLTGDFKTGTTGSDEALDFLSGKSSSISHYAYTFETAQESDRFLSANRFYSMPMIIFGRTQSYWKGSFDFHEKLVIEPGNTIETVEKIGIFTPSPEVYLLDRKNPLDFFQRDGLIKWIQKWAEVYFTLHDSLVQEGIERPSISSEGGRFSSELRELISFTQDSSSDIVELISKIHEFLIRWDDQRG